MISLAKSKTLLLLTTIAIFTCLATAGCQEGDWLGPGERWLRDAVNGWDMWATDSVRPYEDPMPPAVEGTIPTVDRFGYDVALRDLAKFPVEKQSKRAALSYRRFCHHCHGQNGDGRIIVGESLEIKPADLRSPKIQSKTDEELFNHVESGGDLMLPLKATLAPLDIMLTIQHVRTLWDNPSTPYYPIGNKEPIR